jgi:hypothetical protein
MAACIFDVFASNIRAMGRLLVAAFLMLVAGDNAIADDQGPASAPPSPSQINPSNEPSQVSAILLSSAIGVGTVLAQTSAPAPTGQPATSHMSAEQKSAISKSCSDQANAKGLHGKARWNFRAACKRARKAQ